MSSVEGRPPQTGVPPARPAAPAAPLQVQDPGASAPLDAASLLRPPPTDAPAAGPAPPGAPRDPGAGLASLLAQARLAQAQLAVHPLPITNHHSRLILKLFGG